MFVGYLSVEKRFKERSGQLEIAILKDWRNRSTIHGVSLFLQDFVLLFYLEKYYGDITSIRILLWNYVIGNKTFICSISSLLFYCTCKS